MPEDPLEAVFSYVERAYVRYQAGEMLTRCLELGDAAPMQNLVEELVLAGPESLDTLREVLVEVSSRKTQIQDDLSQIYSDLDKKLQEYGIRLAEGTSPQSLVQISQEKLLALIYSDVTFEAGWEKKPITLLNNAQDMMKSLVDYVHLLDDVELFLQDWIWSLMYQSAHQDHSGILVSPAKTKRLL